MTSAQALDDDGLVARTVRHVDYLYEFGEDTGIIQVGFLWIVFILVLLAEYAEDGIWLVSQFFCQFLAGSSPHDDRDEHSRKGNELSGAEHRIDSCRIFCKQCARIAFEIGKHLYLSFVSFHFFYRILIFKVQSYSFFCEFV